MQSVHWLVGLLSQHRRSYSSVVQRSHLQKQFEQRREPKPTAPICGVLEQQVEKMQSQVSEGPVCKHGCGSNDRHPSDDETRTMDELCDSPYALHFSMQH